MFYEYTPESVGGRLIYRFKGPHAWHGYSETLTFGNSTVKVSQSEKDKSVVILVQEQGKFVKVLSTVELEWHKHKTDDYYYPVEINK